MNTVTGSFNDEFVENGISRGLLPKRLLVNSFADRRESKSAIAARIGYLSREAVDRAINVKKRHRRHLNKDTLKDTTSVMLQKVAKSRGLQQQISNLSKSFR